MNKIKKISLLGCGWLGYPLAIELINRGYEVKGSTTRASKFPAFKNAGITPYQITIEDGEITDQTGTGDFFNAQSLIITLPPKIRKKGRNNGISQMEKITGMAKNFGGKVIYTSSTSVYPSNGQIQDEKSLITNPPDNPHPILQMEEMLKNTFGDNLTILRLGGLFGYDRIPVKYFLGKKEIDNAEFPVNYLHRDDAVTSIIRVIEKEAWNKVYNVVAPIHPTRREVFLKSAKMIDGEDAPTFSNETTGNFKIINSDKLAGELGFTYRFADPRNFTYDQNYKPL